MIIKAHSHIVFKYIGEGKVYVAGENYTDHAGFIHYAYRYNPGTIAIENNQTEDVKIYVYQTGGHVEVLKRGWE